MRDIEPVVIPEVQGNIIQDVSSSEDAGEDDGLPDDGGEIAHTQTKGKARGRAKSPQGRWAVRNQGTNMPRIDATWGDGNPAETPDPNTSTAAWNRETANVDDTAACDGKAEADNPLDKVDNGDGQDSRVAAVASWVTDTAAVADPGEGETWGKGAEAWGQGATWEP